MRGGTTLDLEFAPAAASDFAFALSLYLRTMQPYTAALMHWDEAKQRQAFQLQWRPEHGRMLRVSGADIGWLQIEETATEVWLQHFYIAPEHQRRGAGSETLRRLIVEYAVHKPFVLAVLRNNPSRRLYERFGFSVTCEDGIKLMMRRPA